MPPEHEARLILTREQFPTLKGAPWYVVVTGLYTSRKAATSAINAMPAPLLKGKPWPRAVATLK